MGFLTTFLSCHGYYGSALEGWRASVTVQYGESNSSCYITAVNTQASFTAFLLAIEMLLSLSSPLDVTKLESLRFSYPEGAVMGSPVLRGVSILPGRK